jgi:hypothetical protein
VVVAVTNEKLGVPAAFAVIPMQACSQIVVEHDADPTLMKQIAAAGAHLLRAGDA